MVPRPTNREILYLLSGFLLASGYWGTRKHVQEVREGVAPQSLLGTKQKFAQKTSGETRLEHEAHAPAVVQTSQASKATLDVEGMCLAEGGFRSKQSPPDGSRCIFIDTATDYRVIANFQTFTPFSAMTCTWQVWIPQGNRRKRRSTIQLLQRIPGMTLRWMQMPADLSLSMRSNLTEDDYIIVALHAGNLLPTIDLVKQMGRFGVATWVDRWLVSSPISHGGGLPGELVAALRKEIPDLCSFPPYKKEHVLITLKQVTHLLYRPTSRYLHQVVSQKQVFLDFGMNRGDTIYMFLTFAPDPQNWEIWGFEAVPSIIETAIETCQWIEQHYPLALSPTDVNDTYGLRRIAVKHAAAWVENTELDFHTGSVVSGSIFSKNKAHGAVEMTPAIDVANWIRMKYTSNDHIFVKMDIEGAEYPVLRHMLLDGVACWVGKWAVEYHDLRRFPEPPLPAEQCIEVKMAMAKLTAMQSTPLGLLDRRLTIGDESLESQEFL